MTDKRRPINIRISAETLAKFSDVAQRNGYSEKEFFLMGLELARLVLEEQERGNKVIITSQSGDALTRVALPEPESSRINTVVKSIVERAHPSPLERAIADLDPDNPSQHQR